MDLWERIFGGRKPTQAATPPRIERKRIVGSVQTARSDTGLSVSDYVNWKGWPDAFTEGYVGDVPVRDQRFKALVTSYKSATRALERHIAKMRSDRVREEVDQEGLDDAIRNRDDFAAVKDPRFHQLRRRYISAQRALARVAE